MNVGQYCKHAVVTVDAGASISEASYVMRDEHVGFLVVVNEGDPARRPVGVLTDRDIVLQIIARDVSPASVTVADVMTAKPMIATQSDDLNDLMQAMRLAGIRRVPVVDSRGALTGVIAIDDALDIVAGLLCDICGSIRNEQRQEWNARRGAC